jgi:hypothetical protein
VSHFFRLDADGDFTSRMAFLAILWRSSGCYRLVYSALNANA